ncbi:MAG: SufE family protein [Alphaproteobacteria bacterium]|nr:SufE family protein [Alphaproteobacteria bacterium]
MSLETLLEDFALFDDWEDKYRYIIERGNALPPLSPSEQIEAHKVRGCASQVWLISERENDRLIFRGTSDAHIVRGLIAILLEIYSGRTASDILATDANETFSALGLAAHISPQRSNGFQAMVQRVRNDAAALSSD